MIGKIILHIGKNPSKARPWLASVIRSIGGLQKSQFPNSLSEGAVTKLKISVGLTIDKFRLNNFLAINGTILRFAYRKIDVQRQTFSNFWGFYCSYHQILAV